MYYGNDQRLNMNPIAEPPPLTEFKDRRTGLIVFGILLILLGAFIGLLAPLTLFAQIAASRRGGVPANPPFALLTAVIFTLASAATIWLGIGSTLCRRWARALLLCVSWIALIAGSFGIIAVYFSMRNLDQTMRAQGQILQPGVLSVVKIATLVGAFIAYFVIPGSLVLFYRSPNVKRTCEALDPVERWTDRCPLPVLALCLLQATKVLALFLAFSRIGSVAPVAGMLVHGLPARLLWIGYGLFSIYAVRGFYRLRIRVWWIYLSVLIVVWLSAIATFARVGMFEYMRAIGLPEISLRRMDQNPILQGHGIVWYSLANMVIYVGYLVYVRRYFPPGQGNPPHART